MLWWEARGEGPRNVLLLHGWGGAGSGHSWRQIQPHLPSSGWRVAAMDFRGCGRSAAPGACGHSVEQCAEDAVAVADAAGMGSFILAGFSMGGKVAQRVASCHPDRVAGLFLMAPLALGPMPLTETLLQMWLRIAREQERFAEILGAMEQPPVAPEIMRDFYSDCLAAGEDGLAGTFRMCARDAGEQLLPAIRARTLVVGGANDGLMPPATIAERVAGRIRGAATVTLDAGHQMTLTRGAQLAELLRGFVDEGGR